jgi:hypothetical protein
MERDSEKSRKNWDLGQDIIGKYLRNEIAGSEKVQTALQACKVHVGMMATESNRETNVLTAARMVLDDKEREKYIKASMPKLLEKK